MFPNVEDTKRKIEVMQAYADGKRIEMKFPSGSSWEECDAPAWDWTALDYRIKPKPRVLWENEYQEIADPDVILRQVFWDELEARNAETPNGRKSLRVYRILIAQDLEP